MAPAWSAPAPLRRRSPCAAGVSASLPSPGPPSAAGRHSVSGSAPSPPHHTAARRTHPVNGSPDTAPPPAAHHATAPPRSPTPRSQRQTNGTASRHPLNQSGTSPAWLQTALPRSGVRPSRPSACPSNPRCRSHTPDGRAAAPWTRMTGFPSRAPATVPMTHPARSPAHRPPRPAAARAMQQESGHGSETPRACCPAAHSADALPDRTDRSAHTPPPPSGSPADPPPSRDCAPH